MAGNVKIYDLDAAEEAAAPEMEVCVDCGREFERTWDEEDWHRCPQCQAKLRIREAKASAAKRG